MKPLTKKQFVAQLRNIAKQLDMPYEDRDEEFEDGLAAWMLAKAAGLIEQYAPEVLP